MLYALYESLKKLYSVAEKKIRSFLLKRKFLHKNKVILMRHFFNSNLFEENALLLEKI